MASLLRITRLLRPFRGRVLLALLLSALTVGSSVGLMITSAWLISTAALQLGIVSLGVAPTAVRFFGLARAVLRYLERLVSHDVTLRLLARLRVWFYERIEPLSLVQLQGFRTGELAARLVSDVETLQNFYLQVVSPPIVAGLVISGVGLVFSLFDRVTALLLVTLMTLSALLLPALTWAVGRRPGAQAAESRNRLAAQLVETVQGLAESLAFGRAACTQARLSDAGERLARHERRMGRLDGLQAGLSVLLVNLTAAAVLWAALGRVDGVWLAALTLGAIAAFEAVLPLATAGSELGAELSAAGRVLEVLDSAPALPEPALPAPLPGPTPALHLEEVTFRYQPDEPPVLAGFSLRLPYGSRALITGESGSGKSSLVYLLLRLADYQGGRISLDGVDLRAFAHEDVRRTFAVMTQRTHLFNTTIRENLRIGRKTATDEEIAAAARAAQVHDFIRSLPDGYDTYVGEGGALLSGGERRRIALARMLLKEAPIWLLDEPEAALDPITARQVMQAVLAAGAGRTIILLTHRPGLVAGERFDQHIALPDSDPRPARD